MAMPKKRPGRPMVEELTGSQQRTLEEIQRIIARDQRPPTMQELATVMGVTAASIHEQVGQLVRKGYLKREPRQARNLTVLQGPPEAVAELIEIPIVGTVAAGLPVLAEENIVGHVIIEGSLARRGRCFALQVVGDSMILAGIKAKDLVIVRQQAVAENGDIVVAMLEGEATVKRLSICEEVVQLCPENPKFQPIVVDPDQEFRILGKVVGVRRMEQKNDPPIKKKRSVG
ncbi:MAG: lexA [Planctomycetaceae bacterium]|nr:lexA [Planctomycetaceae bacterium]